MPWPVESLVNHAAAAGVDCPAERMVGGVVDRRGRYRAQVAQDPAYGAVGCHFDPVRGRAVDGGELVNCDSQPTESVEIWQRVSPDFVSM